MLQVIIWSHNSNIHAPFIEDRFILYSLLNIVHTCTKK